MPSASLPSFFIFIRFILGTIIFPKAHYTVNPTMATSCWAASIALVLLLPIAAATLRQVAPPSSSLAARRLATPDGDLRFHEATFIASHNAHATLADAEGVLEPLGANQDDDILDQLRNDGVRGLLLDIELNEEEEEEPLRLVHASSFLTLDYGGFRTVLGSKLVPFLEENDDAIISLFIETKGDNGNSEESSRIRGAILEQLKSIFSTLTVKGVSLKNMTFRYEMWQDQDDWPKLDELRQSNQRIFVFMDRSEYEDTEFGYMFNQHVLQENDWQGIDDCAARYMWGSGKVSLPTNNNWTRLFFMNHFSGGSGPESKGNTVGEALIGGGNNGWGNLFPRIEQCMESNGGFKPNFIALDWVAQGKEAKEIRDYLNFGGRLGTGQTCVDDSHCATSSCNVMMGECQCQQCPADSVDVCPGCDSGQYCSSLAGEGMNVCQNIGGSTQSSSPSPSSSVGGGSGSPNQSPAAGSPTQSPTENKLTDTFYCGDDYFSSVSLCNEAVKCPGGNDDCPDGQTCFAGVDCTLPPTVSPSAMPSYSPSSSPSTSKPTASPIAISDIFPPASTQNRNFCGTNSFDTRANCQDALPCNDNPNKCAILLGPDYTCFSDIVCATRPTNVVGGGNPPNFKPTLAPSDTWSSNIGLTNAPSDSQTSSSTTGPTGAPSLLRPTFLNKFYCGKNYTHAEDTCTVGTPCPTGSPAVCGDGGTCYGGITCTAPPTPLPTSPPTPLPTNFPENYPPSASGTNPSPVGPSWGQSQTSAPFDSQLYENKSRASMSANNEYMSGKIVSSIMIAVGLVGLLV
ncbi:hypothetical protein ACHAXR_011841 [Thalassiosira sp. AJA248-18]